MIVTEEYVVSDELEMEINRTASFFYVDDGLITLSCPYWIQWDVDVLAGRVDWVGLWESSVKKVGVV